MAQRDKELRRIQDSQRYRKNPEPAKARARKQHTNDPDYINTRNTDRRQRIRDFVQQQKVGLVCIQCGIADVRVLDFHHLDKNGKEGSIGKAAALNWSEDRILKEIAKCEVLCSNCHRILHWEERNGA
jgi:hypothetical protein